jgi:2-hydroxy-3-oxopropionate reductase
MKVGFVGLGIMGHPMALNLAKGGHQLYVYGRRTCPPSVKETGAIVCDTLSSLAEESEIVIIMVPDTPDVADVLFSADGLAAGLSAGKIVVDMSSISPIETKKFAHAVAALGCGYVDAPVSGGEVGAKAASLTIMVGGSESDFATVKPLFELMGKNITLVGDVGAGQTTKVANQIIVALTIEAVGEACSSPPRRAPTRPRYARR